MQVIKNIPSLDLEAEHKSGLKTHPLHFLIIFFFFKSFPPSPNAQKKFWPINIHQRAVMNSSILLQSVGTVLNHLVTTSAAGRAHPTLPTLPAATSLKKEKWMDEISPSSGIPQRGAGGASPRQDPQSHQILLELLPPGHGPPWPSHLQACKELSGLFLSRNDTRIWFFSCFLMYSANMLRLEYLICKEKKKNKNPSTPGYCNHTELWFYFCVKKFS